MRPQLDLPSGGVIFALGVVGLGGTCAAWAQAEAPGAPVPLGGALAPAFPPVTARAAFSRVSVWTSRRDLLVGRAVAISGALRPDSQRRAAALQERGPRGWATVARAAVSPSGRFRVGFTPPDPGTLALRVRVSGDGVSAPALSAQRLVTVYRRASASWYGPGGPLACGGTLTASRLGVAHRTLPCGTLVRLHLGNRTVRVPVIDRGPYVAGRDYDLTPATKRALGFGDTGELWASR